LHFRRGKEMARTIRIIKTRGTAHDQGEHKLEITNSGVFVQKFN